MKSDDLMYVRYTIMDEGFDYAFMYYSDFSEIDDLEFQRLRLDYMNAYKALWAYLDMDNAESEV